MATQLPIRRPSGLELNRLAIPKLVSRHRQLWAGQLASSELLGGDPVLPLLRQCRMWLLSKMPQLREPSTDQYEPYDQQKRTRKDQEKSNGYR